MPRVAVDVMLKRRSSTRGSRRSSGPCRRSASTVSDVASASTSSSPSATAVASGRPARWPSAAGQPGHRGVLRAPPARLSGLAGGSSADRPSPAAHARRGGRHQGPSLATTALVAVAGRRRGNRDHGGGRGRHLRGRPRPAPGGGPALPPAAGQSHGVSDLRVPILEPGNRDRLVRAQAGCPGSTRSPWSGRPMRWPCWTRRRPSCAPCAPPRSSGPGPGSRTPARRSPSLSSSWPSASRPPSSATARRGSWVHAKFQQGEAAADRVAVVLAHEGAHVAAGGPPDAAGELAARQAELEACGRLFTGGAQPNRGCADAAALLSEDDATAVQRLKEAGYR